MYHAAKLEDTPSKKKKNKKKKKDRAGVNMDSGFADHEGNWSD